MPLTRVGEGVQVSYHETDIYLGEFRLTPKERSTSLTVGVVIAREATDHPWQDHRWRPADILIGRPELELGHIISSSKTATLYYAGSFTIELHRKETSAYVVNLENDPPVIYAVLGEPDEDDEPDDVDLPVRISYITVSPFEAQDFLDSGEDIVEPLAMPEPLIAWIERFVAEHHEEETFIKRKRDRVDIRHEKFGQEPLEQIRRRQKHH